MGGDFTNTRQILKNLPFTYRDGNGTVIKGYDVQPLSSVKTVTSYRSTGRNRRETDDQLIADFTRTQQNGYFVKDPVDTGHEFFMRHKRQTMSHTNYHAWSPGQLWSWNGSLRPYFSPSTLDKQYPVVDFMTTDELIHYGMLAISATAPNQPSAAVATALGELFRDGVPDLSVLFKSITNKTSNTGRRFVNKRKRIDGSTSGKEFLNYQFGWNPLIRDYLGVLKAVVQSREILNQYVRDGQPGLYVRRRWASDPTSTTSQSMITPGWTLGQVPSQVYLPGYNIGEVRQWDTRTERYTASLAYSYHVNVDNSFLGRLDRYANEAQKLLGLGITPEVLWDLTPFSWLADWKFDIGLAIGNATRFQDDDLVLRWGYLMREVSATRIYTLMGIRFKSGDPGAINFSLRTVTKERRRATPYGFAVNPVDFTAPQWAILAALGLTKANKVLW
jgi:hypothetical protein